MNEINEIKKDLLKRFKKLRKTTVDFTSSLNPEDMVIQTNEFVSPIKWHLAHTTWFFENFILEKKKGYKLFDKSFNYLFNSYYKQVGNYNPKTQRGFISRPYVTEIFKYRDYVDDNMIELLSQNHVDEKKLFLIELGINHEQQHQELMIMDILNIFSSNPTYPNFLNKRIKPKKQMASKTLWRKNIKTTLNYGASNNYFAYDNEYPRGKYELPPFELTKNFITNSEWQEFIEEDGYNRPEFWLSDGWDYIKKFNINKPLYWIDFDNEFTLHGVEKIRKNKPVSNISFYEAYAFSKFKKKRLPSEFEIELYLQNHKKNGNFLENNFFEPVEFSEDELEENAYGNLWLWTSSNYNPYPGYKPFQEKLGEYNQKFMCNQFVLKGGSFSTPKDHIRASYRNFYYPTDRWHFCGLKLANDLN